jgi:hypothetical protein
MTRSRDGETERLYNVRDCSSAGYRAPLRNRFLVEEDKPLVTRPSWFRW